MCVWVCGATSKNLLVSLPQTNVSIPRSKHQQPTRISIRFEPSLVQVALSAGVVCLSTSTLCLSTSTLCLSTSTLYLSRRPCVCRSLKLLPCFFTALVDLNVSGVFCCYVLLLLIFQFRCGAVDVAAAVTVRASELFL